MNKSYALGGKVYKIQLDNDDWIKVIPHVYQLPIGMEQNGFAEPKVMCPLFGEMIIDQKKNF